MIDAAVDPRVGGPLEEVAFIGSAKARPSTATATFVPGRPLECLFAEVADLSFGSSGVPPMSVYRETIPFVEADPFEEIPKVSDVTGLPIEGEFYISGDLYQILLSFYLYAKDKKNKDKKNKDKNNNGSAA